MDVESSSITDCVWMLNLVVLLTVTSRMLTEVLKLSQKHTCNVYQRLTMKIGLHHSPIVVV